MTIPPTTPPGTPLRQPHLDASATHNRNHDANSHVVLQVGAIHGEVTIHTATPTNHNTMSTTTRTVVRPRHIPATATPTTTTPPTDERTGPLPALRRSLSSTTATARPPSPRLRDSTLLPTTAFYNTAFRESDSPDDIHGMSTPTAPHHRAIDHTSAHRSPYSHALLRWLSCLAPTPIPLTLIDTKILATSPAFAGLTHVDLTTGLDWG